MQNNNRKHRIASARVSYDGRQLGRCWVELLGDIVVNYGELHGELPFTEWTEEPLFIVTDTAGVPHLKSQHSTPY